MGLRCGPCLAHSSSLLSSLTPAGFLDAHLLGCRNEMEPPSLSSATANSDKPRRDNVRDGATLLAS